MTEVDNASILGEVTLEDAVADLYLYLVLSEKNSRVENSSVVRESRARDADSEVLTEPKDGSLLCSKLSECAV